MKQTCTDIIKLNVVPIPKRFMLMGQMIEVEWDELLHHNEDSLGMAVYSENKVLLQPSIKGQPTVKDQMEEVFLHELFHWVFKLLGRRDLRTDETLVEQIANLVHQAYKTAEY